MIGFIDTFLQLQSVITAHTLNSFRMNYDSSLTKALAGISEESLTELTILRPEYRSPSPTVHSFFIICNIVFKHPVALL
jgi:hypothetical protein